MITLLKEVGRGKRGARDLTYEEARKAARLILSGEATPVQIGAFLVAERIKMESIEEIQAFVHTCKEQSQRYPMPGGLDCSGPYDGRTRTFIATIPTAFVLSACGLPVTLHGSKSLPPKWGITLSDVFSALGVPAGELPSEALTAAAEQTSLLFVPAERWCPALAQMRPYREQLGLRTVFNSAEKLLRYSEADYMVTGVFHGTVFEKMAKLVGDLGVKRGLIVQGMEGSEDLTVDKRTRTYTVNDGHCELFVIDPEVYELQTELPEVPEGYWDAQQQAATCMSVLHGNAELAYVNMVLLNSAVRLWIAEKAESIEQGVYIAKGALESGDALRQFEAWQHGVMKYS
ncbi:anthranilate phosphoribosyltransferase [Paenibacillus swuensis]|uniref:Anthranilate phosphoribosyltransferase n=1 Tax=Paenibacillus swuensis TaxID=1178515 RepID=A0A172TM62_9BACL|nr:anthranilate phosphoribosyltransferase [Paenibacillus swuensis]ANE48120.1 anthranilate phosphoribosyltransferase [Paenibacillus swuensis]